ncbi:unnamed protein product [Trifolium pratense]|uniref:Uncharacterized protein n=1 Tax=Trifolium pratense TaxID=57577 RepID=A0ACB0L5N9_TRIPR|nr:unnamed protein product [Trifolium pratense]
MHTVDCSVQIHMMNSAASAKQKYKYTTQAASATKAISNSDHEYSISIKFWFFPFTNQDLNIHQKNYMGLSEVKINSNPLQVCFGRNAIQTKTTNEQPFTLGQENINNTTTYRL